jgi:hypothetical protein
MNRHERRKAKARKARENKFVNDYVRHLPEVSGLELGVVTHMVCAHDDWCDIYKKGGGLENCTCSPTISYHAEPRRS